LLPPNKGFFGLTVSIPPDNLPIDDKRYFVLDVKEGARILIAGNLGKEGEEDQAFYLQTAISPGEVSTGFTTDLCTPSEFPTRNFDQYDSIIYAGGSAPEPSLCQS